MLAFYRGPGIAEFAPRLAASLGLFGPGRVLSCANPEWCAAVVPWEAGRTAAVSRNRNSPLHPARARSGRIVLFNGWFDNLADLAHELAMPANDPAAVYGAAVDRWEDGADGRIIGQYCAIVAEPDAPKLRLSRSALTAPPLHYVVKDQAIAAASVPRALLALGLSDGLDQRKIVDVMFVNPCGREDIHLGMFRVGVGEIVHLDPVNERVVQTFDALAIRPDAGGGPQDWVREADRLLRESCSRALAGSRQPGILLSGGLDSTNVAARALQFTPDGKRLKSFTFTPVVAWRDPDHPWFFGDERPAVEAFAAMHPALEPHFTDLAESDHNTDLDQLLLAIGTAPGGLGPSFGFRALYRMAQQQSCDVMLSADFGNFSFSQTGNWAFGEHFRKLRWVSLIRALKGELDPSRPLWRRFISRSLIPHLPDRWWRRWRGWRDQLPTSDNLLIGLVKPEALARHGAWARAAAAGVLYERDQYAWRRDLLADQFRRGDAESGDLLQGFEQVYGIRTRDVAAYRPLVEFCLSLPTDAFIQNGEQRWLARALGRGMIPESIRTERRIGFQQADWHERLTPRRDQLRAEIGSARALPELAELLDFDRMDALLDDWPGQPSLDVDTFAQHSVGLMRAMAMARFVRFATGRNAA